MTDDEGAAAPAGGPSATVDLDTCADEPIRIPGFVQPHGVLLAVTEPDLVVRHASANVAGLTGLTAEEALGRTLDDVVGTEAARAVRVHVRAWGDLRARNPVEVTVAGPDGGTVVGAGGPPRGGGGPPRPRGGAGP